MDRKKRERCEQKKLINHEHLKVIDGEKRKKNLNTTQRHNEFI